MGMWGLMMLVCFVFFLEKNKLQGRACRQKQSDLVSALLKRTATACDASNACPGGLATAGKGGNHLEIVLDTEDSEVQRPLRGGWQG